MKWYLKELKEWIKNDCDKETALQITDLDLSSYGLKIIPKEIGNFINLQCLNLKNNYIKTIPKEIGNLINLKCLNLSTNNIKIVPKEIGNLIQLNILNLENNEIKIITEEICNLINLEYLNLSFNNIKIIPAEIGNLINLKTLYLTCINYNHITNIFGLNKYPKIFHTELKFPIEFTNLINLKHLDITHNNLTEIPNVIYSLSSLKVLDISHNKLITIPIDICNMINLEKFIYYANVIEYITPQVQRFLKKNKTIQKIYNDNQSVHNHNIQEGIIKSINYIMSIKPIYNLNNLNDIIVKNQFINNKTKIILFEYINCNDIHSTLNVTFAELLINILSFIDQHKAKVEIYKVLEQEMNDALCKCFTGRMSRLINCLNGFDKHIIINISDTEQIGNIIILIKNKLILENKYTIELHKEIVMKELYDRGYDKGIVDEWIQYI
jgi:Leucine-rich repeat (LRR) protein